MQTPLTLENFVEPTLGLISSREQISFTRVNYLKAILVLVLSTLVARIMLPFFDLSNVVMVYILAIVIIASNYGRGPSILSSVLSVAAFDYFFVPPFHTFVVADTQHLVTFLVMLVIAVVVSTLTVQVRMQAETAHLREKRTRALYSMSTELADRVEKAELVQIGMRHISEVFECKVALCTPGQIAGSFEIYEFDELALDSDEIDRALVQKILNMEDFAVVDSAVVQGGKVQYVPMRVAEQCLGVLCVSALYDKRSRSIEHKTLLKTFVNQLTFALERLKLSQDAELTRLRVRTEELKNSLLSSVSHDLRTPLATITGAASGIMDSGSGLDLPACRQLGMEIFNESVRLNKLVTNLLDMSKVDSGSLQLEREALLAEELIGSALASLRFCQKWCSDHSRRPLFLPGFHQQT